MAGLEEASGWPRKTKDHSRAVKRVRGKKKPIAKTFMNGITCQKRKDAGRQICVAHLNSAECITTSRLFSEKYFRDISRSAKCRYGTDNLCLKTITSTSYNNKRRIHFFSCKIVVILEYQKNSCSWNDICPQNLKILWI